jgi:hypothetical protein
MADQEIKDQLEAMKKEREDDRKRMEALISSMERMRLDVSGSTDRRKARTNPYDTMSQERTAGTNRLREIGFAHPMSPTRRQQGPPEREMITPPRRPPPPPEVRAREVEVDDEVREEVANAGQVGAAVEAPQEPFVMPVLQVHGEIERRREALRDAREVREEEEDRQRRNVSYASSSRPLIKTRLPTLPMPKFDGKDSLDDFAVEWSRWARLHGVEALDEETLVDMLISACQGEAKKVAMSLERTHRSWDWIITGLQKAYPSTKTEAGIRQQIQDLNGPKKNASSEELELFLFQFGTLVDLLPSESHTENDQMIWLMSKMDDATFKATRATKDTRERSGSLDGLVEVWREIVQEREVEKLVMSQRQRDRPGKPIMAALTTKDDDAGKAKSHQGQRKYPPKPRPKSETRQQNSTATATVVCWKCGKRGHYKFECRKPSPPPQGHQKETKTGGEGGHPEKREKTRQWKKEKGPPQQREGNYPQAQQSNPPQTFSRQGWKSSTQDNAPMEIDQEERKKRPRHESVRYHQGQSKSLLLEVELADRTLNALVRQSQ